MLDQISEERSLAYLEKMRLSLTDRLTVHNELTCKFLVAHGGHESVKGFNVLRLIHLLGVDQRKVNERFGPVAAQGIGFIFMSNH